ncbi:MAG: VCBS repeat-containing protein [Bacteroidetes bacterium]|nr:VCBS repeat-containing protein [Bacteroidota bacterium]
MARQLPYPIYREYGTMKFLLLFLACTVGAAANGIDTLRTYDARGGYAYYADPSVTMQAARFDLSAPGTLQTVVVLLGGPSSGGSATLHIYGHEGGLPAPGVGRDLVAPITVRKSHAGVERIVVPLKRPVHILSHQFFVALDNVSPGVTVLSDRRKRNTVCADSTDSYAFQLLRGRRRQWAWGVYSYLIDAVVEYDFRSATNGGFADMTSSLGLPDSLARSSSIAWADVDRDGYLDLLVDGRLYHNDHGARFTNITAQAGIAGLPRAAVFIDADNDGAIDVLFLGLTGSDSGASALFVNDGSGRFTRHALDLPSIREPASVCIGDADHDGFLDFFVGQSGARDVVPRNYLLINNGHLGFVDRSAELLNDSARTVPVAGAQWVDVDNVGRLDLFIASDDGTSDQLLRRQVGGAYRNAIQYGQAGFGTAGARAGCHWADCDNDGTMDLLLPVRSALAMERDRGETNRPVLKRVAAGRYDWNATEPVEYEEARAGGAWGDVNNDGLLDMILTTSCNCRYASIYEQVEGGAFAQRTWEYGFARVAAGRDAMWIDFDNDGRLDLATFVDGRFRLYRNACNSGNNHVELDLDGPHAVGARAEVYTGNGRYTQVVTSGRGLLMQDPLRLHFGLAGASRIDSAVILWSNGRREVQHDLVMNSLNRIREGSASGAEDVAVQEVSASPNPFTTHVEIAYTLPVAGDIRVGIYTMGGTCVRTLVDARQPAGRSVVVWKGDDANGDRVAQGTYIYRLVSGGHEVSGKVVLMR